MNLYYLNASVAPSICINHFNLLVSLYDGPLMTSKIPKLNGALKLAATKKDPSGVL